ncbi:MAG: hypothetical protein RL227_2292 [Pseudomonadota bacterium]
MDVDTRATVRATFTVTNTTLGAPVAGTVGHDSASRTALSAPSTPATQAASTLYTVRLGGTATDVAGNGLAGNTAVWLGTAASFGAFGGGAGVTNQGINTMVAGNVGTTAASTLVAGLHDADLYTETPLNVGVVTGRINCGPPAPGTLSTLAAAMRARADAQTAHDTLAALPPGSDPGAGQLGGLVLTAGCTPPPPAPLP